MITIFQVSPNRPFKLRLKKLKKKAMTKKKKVTMKKKRKPSVF